MRHVIIIIITLIAWGASAEVMALRNIDIGESYPPFCAPQLNGAQICSGKYKDNILVVSFVRIKQKESLKIMLALEDLHVRYSTKNVSIICLLSGEIDRQELTDFTDKNKLTLPLILDRDREIYGGFGVFVYPTTALFDQDGKLSYLFGSNTINIRKRMEGCIQFLLKEIGAREFEEIMHPVVKKIDPEDAKAQRYYNFAKKSFASQHFSKARKIVESSLEKYPNHALSHSLYGYILVQEEAYQLGLEQFEIALELDPDLEEAKAGRQICMDKTSQ